MLEWEMGGRGEFDEDGWKNLRGDRMVDSLYYTPGTGQYF